MYIRTYVCMHIANVCGHTLYYGTYCVYKYCTYVLSSHAGCLYIDSHLFLITAICLF